MSVLMKNNRIWKGFAFGLTLAYLRYSDESGSSGVCLSHSLTAEGFQQMLGADLTVAEDPHSVKMILSFTGLFLSFPVWHLYFLPISSLLRPGMAVVWLCCYFFMCLCVYVKNGKDVYPYLSQQKIMLSVTSETAKGVSLRICDML